MIDIPDPQAHQSEIYNKIKNKDFSSAPNYLNGLDETSPTISENNKALLQNLKKITKYFLITPLEIIYKEQHGIFTSTTNEREKCPICLCEFYDDVINDDPKNLDLKDLNTYTSHEIDTIKLFRCEDHFYHIECLLNFVQQQTGFKCAICQKIYGIIMGDMPPGKMSITIDDKLKCSGYKKYGTIIVHYKIKNGKNFTGTARKSYIPNTKKGRILLGLLKIAFDRRLTFTVGTSVTTGEQNTVVWNGIHHKTTINGGPTNFGYPDPTYFNRVTEELASKGVNIEDYNEKELEFLGLSLMYGK
jgi:deltex-like protein